MSFYRRKHRGIALASLLGLWIASLAGTVCPSAQVRSHKSSIDFNRDIRPILSENCYACHGPDSLKRKAGLRLDKEEGALGELKSGNHAIIPGDISKSALIARITALDQDDRMPPAKTGKHLTPGQIDTLRRWIADGAECKKHWSFIAPERTPLPVLQN